MLKRIILYAMALAPLIPGALAQTRKAQPKTTTTSSLKASMTRGKAVYATYCMTCHQADGGGVPNMNAPLIKTSYVLGPKKQLINILLNGMQGVDIDGESFTNVMPAATYLNNQQIADVLTYIRNSFGNKASLVTASEVAAVRKK